MENVKPEKIQCSGKTFDAAENSSERAKFPVIMAIDFVPSFLSAGILLRCTISALCDYLKERWRRL